MNFYPHHIGDYKAATAHLSNEEDLAYRRLLEMYYDTEQSIPVDTQWVSRRLRVGSDVLQTVLKDFFLLTSEGFRHARCDLEIREYNAKAEIARANGKKGGRRKAAPINEKNPAGSNPVSGGLAEETQGLSNQEPLPINQSLPLSVPDCPHNLLIDLFAKHLPQLPQPRKSLWSKGKNAPAMKERWHWVLTENNETGKHAGERMATNMEEGLRWFNRFFAYVAMSDFLTGKDSKWSCDLIWLVNKSNFEKVIQGTYENKETQ